MALASIVSDTVIGASGLPGRKLCQVATFRGDEEANRESAPICRQKARASTAATIWLHAAQLDRTLYIRALHMGNIWTFVCARLAAMD